jgi:hypothetical protein
MNQWQLKKTIPCRHAKGMALAPIKNDRLYKNLYWKTAGMSR